MSGVLRAITSRVSWGGDSGGNWEPQNIARVRLRTATQEEIECYDTDQRNQWKIVRWIKGAWTILERTVNSVHLVFTRNIKANYERSIDRDPFLSSHKTWFLPDACLISHPSILHEVMNYHRHDPDGIFQMGNKTLADSLIKEMFDDEEVQRKDLLFLNATPDVTHKYHSFFARFFTKKNLACYIPEINQCVLETVHQWGGQKKINLTQEAKVFSCKIMAALFLGVSERYNEIVKAIDVYNAYLSAKFQRKAFDHAALGHARHFFKEISEKAIKDASSEESPPSLVKAMIRDGSFTKKEIYLTIFHLFFAGVDNSASTITHAIMKCAQDQSLQQRIRTECEEVSSQHDGRNLYELTGQLDLVHRIMAESLRVFPPAYKVTRIAAKPAVLEINNTAGQKIKRFIPQNTRLELMMSAAAKCSSLYHGTPELFHPDRYQEQEVPSSFAALPWLPFGKGTHSCPGRALFQTESKLLLASLVLHYRLSTNVEGNPKQVGTAFNRLNQTVTLWLEPEPSTPL